MTTATANAPAGTKGRKVTVTYENGRVATFTQKNGNYLAVITTDPDGHYKGTDGIVGCSATPEGAAKIAARFMGFENGYTNLRIVQIVEVTA